jgi:hypothetical protein
MMIFTRLADWDRRLARVTEKHIESPGVWGDADCLLTLADAVEAVTGTDPAADIRGRYTTERGASRILKRRGFANVEEVLASLFPPVGRLLAQRGDAGVIARHGVLAAGYVTEYGLAVKTGRGLDFHPQTEIKSAFKVG